MWFLKKNLKQTVCRDKGHLMVVILVLFVSQKDPGDNP